MVDGKKLAKAGFAYLGVSYDEMDCQKFVEKCLADCGDHTDLGGSNSWYREVRKNGWVGTPEECRAKYGSVPPGAFLFILEDVSESTPSKFRNDGIGDATHIGLVTGSGKGAIHSSYSNHCVCESKFEGKTIKNGGWNRVGLWNRVDYGLTGASGGIDGAGTDATDTGTADASGGSPAEDAGSAEVTTEIRMVWAANGKPINLRKSGSTTASLIDRVPVGEMVEVLKNTGGWSRVRWRGKTGWIKNDFLIPESEAAGMPTTAASAQAIVTSANGGPVKMRRKPSVKCEAWEDVPNGTVVTVDRRGPVWSQISHGKRYGWYMKTEFLKDIGVG